MTRPEITRLGTIVEADYENERIIDPAVYLIPEFCIAHRMSESFYYKIRKLDLGPEETRTLDHVTVTGAAAKRWRRKREAETRLLAAQPPTAA